MSYDFRVSKFVQLQPSLTYWHYCWKPTTE